MRDMTLVMYIFFEYCSSILLWIGLFGIVFLLAKMKQNNWASKVKFFDLFLAAIFFNALFYLVGIKASDFFNSNYDEIRNLSDEPWGILWVEYFFDTILNWILVLAIPLFFIFNQRR